MDIDECESSPCKNNGTCHDMVSVHYYYYYTHRSLWMSTLLSLSLSLHFQVAGYVCTCAKGLTGTDCDSPIPPACELLHPCASGLECIDEEDGGCFCQLCIGIYLHAHAHLSLLHCSSLYYVIATVFMSAIITPALWDANMCLSAVPFHL